MAKSPAWSEEDIEILKELYPIYGKNLCWEEFFPNRSISAISLKASRLGILYENNPRKGRTHEDYLKLINLDKVEPLEQYKGSTEKILHRCKKCNHEWLARPQQFINNPTAECPVCAANKSKVSLKTIDSVLKVKNLLRKSDYIGSLDPITVQHLSCGYEYVTKYTYIQQGSGCPICNKGFGYLPKTEDQTPEEALLYVIEVTLKDTCKFLKIGVTSRIGNLNKRIAELKSSIGGELVDAINVLYTKKDAGINILQLEHKILSITKEYKYTHVEKFDGSTELRNVSCKETLLNKLNNEVL